MTSAMTNEATQSGRAPRGVVTAGIALVVLGMQMFIIQPGFVTLFVSDLGFDEATAGYIASAEMFGIAAATIFAAGIGARYSWRAIGTAATLLLVAANTASAAAAGETLLLLLRAAAGFGSGLLISLGYAMVGQARDKDRAFGYAITVILLYGAIAIFLLPAAAKLLGTAGLFLLLAGATFAFFAALPFVPAAIADGSSAPTTKARDADLSVGPTEFAALLAVVIFFLGQGVVWAYLGLIGLSHGIHEQAVSNGLTVSQFAGIAGALSLVWLAARMRFLVLLAIGCAGSIASLLALVLPVDAFQYAVSVTFFNFFANLMTAMLMAMAAKIGGDGRFIQTAAALQMIGLAAGPTFSALLIADGGFSDALVMASALFVLVMASAVFARFGSGESGVGSGITNRNCPSHQ